MRAATGGLVLLSLVAACHDAPLVAAPGSLRVEESSLTFPATYLGATSQLTLTLVNDSQAAHHATLSIVGPSASGEPPPVFALDRGSVEVAAASSASVTVTFSPMAIGAALGTLRFVPDDAALSDLALSGTGLADLPCSTPPACQVVTFEPLQGQCVTTVLPDGSACTDSCLNDTRCLGGACVGTPVSCDNQNPCTADSCEPGIGCLHTASTADCPQPTDLCHVATCSLAVGCGMTIVGDGNACGSFDCTSAHVCLNGVCAERAVPEGALCGQATPCQPQGTCHGQVCIQVDAGATNEAWEYDLKADAGLHWLALSDDQDNLYWAQHSFEPEGDVTFELVSVARDGYPRYTETLGRYAPGAHQHDVNLKMMGLLHDPLVVVFGQPNELQAFSQSDGTLAWSDNFSDLLSRSYHPEAFTGEDDIHVAQLVDDGDELVVSLIGVSHTDATDYSWGTWVRGLSWADGAVLWEWTVDGRSRRTVADGFGNLYVAMWTIVSSPERYFFANGVTNFAAIDAGALYALSPSGVPLWQHEQTQLLDIAADGNRLFVDQMETPSVCLIDQSIDYAATGTLDEALQTQVPWATFVYDWPMLSKGLVYRLAVPAQTSCSGTPTDAWLRAFDDATASPAWTFGEDLQQSNISAETLTEDGSVLFASADLDGGANLRVVQPDGGEAFVCPVVPFSVLTEPVLQKGRWIVGGSGPNGDVVISYEMPPTWVPATSGWTANRGNMRRTNHPQ